MPTMSKVERALCRTGPWPLVAGRAILPWALRGETLSGNVLEIGAGSGAMAAAALRRFPDARFTVTDYDDAMVSTAGQRLAGRATVRQADATALPFPDASFDVVLSFVMLHHVVDWEAAFAECARVLRPGGRLIGYDLLDSPTNRLVHVVDRSPYKLLSLRDVAGGLAEAGFVLRDLRAGRLAQTARFTAVLG